MNPYLATAIAMCAIVFIAIFLTGYMATRMNRRAKADLAEKLQPLADMLEGELLAEEVTVRGRWRGQIAEGRMANALDGPGRVFFTKMIDSSGGSAWSWTSSAPRKAEEEREIKYECSAEALVCEEVETMINTHIGPLIALAGWTRVEYDPTAGYVRLTKPMLTRNDIPDVSTFETELDSLYSIGESNRAIMKPIEVWDGEHAEQ
ncbi:hypothetical protein BH09CHL1_BH09CHL1_14490 [soil metagenome]